jgi:hypothetical protein
MAEIVGVDHVSIGTDQFDARGCVEDYTRWVYLVAALLRSGFTPEKAGKIAGGNYLRIFRAAVGLWTYLPWGPYSGPKELCAQIDAVRASGARPEYALIDLASGKPFGQASYLNIDPAAGSIEVGGIVYAPAFQRGIAATEAMYLMMRHVSDELGYRRYAWQCNSLNPRSRQLSPAGCVVGDAKSSPTRSDCYVQTIDRNIDPDIVRLAHLRAPSLLMRARALATVRVWKIWLEHRARPRSDSQDAHGLPVMAGPVCDRATVIPENARFQTYNAPCARS